MKGFSLVETMLVLALGSGVAGLALFIFHQSSNLFNQTDVSFHMVERITWGLNQLKKDLRETNPEMINTKGGNFDPNFIGSKAIVMASSRDINNEFKFIEAGNDIYTCDWRGVVVYCPYKTDHGVKELRRYYRATEDSFTSITFGNISADTIEVNLTDPFEPIDRNKDYEVVGSMLNKVTFDEIVVSDKHDNQIGTMIKCTLKTRARESSGKFLYRTLSTTVCLKN